MYSGYFGFSDAPFSIAPDPRFLYLSAHHREALAHLLYGVEQGGFVVLTGEVGTGKTTVCRCLLQQLPAHVDVAYIINPRQSVTELLQSILAELGIELDSDITSGKVLVDLLNERLLEGHAQGRNTILIIDEAQNLSTDVLEQLRLLTNLETSQRKLLQLILLGQPELNALLDSQQLRQLAQRVTARYHLSALSSADVREYVLHRLGIAGFRGELFTRPALRRVARRSGGVPRLINLICDRALLGVYSTSGQRVNRAIIDRAASEVLSSGRSPGRQWWAVVVVFCFVLMAGWLYRETPLHSALRQAPAGTALPAANASAAGGETAPRAVPAEKADTKVAALPPDPAPGTAPETSPVMAPAAASTASAGGLGANAGGAAPPGQEPTAVPIANPASPGVKKSSAGPAPASDAKTATLTDAMAALAGLWQTGLAPDYRCPGRIAPGLWCEQRTVTLERLRAMGIPAVLELDGSSQAGSHRYVLVEQIRDTHVAVRRGGEETGFRLSMENLERRWKGRAWFISPLDPKLTERLPVQVGAALPPGLDALPERIAEWAGVDHYPGFRRSVLTEQRPPGGLAGVLFERFDVINRDGPADRLTPALSTLLRDYQRRHAVDATGELDPLTALHLSVTLRPGSPRTMPPGAAAHSNGGYTPAREDRNPTTLAADRH